jgi:hypothetical protein
MGYIHVEVANDFNGESVVLVAMDSVGLLELESALSSLGENISRSADINYILKDHELVIEEGSARVDLKGNRVTWHLSIMKTEEIIAKLKAMEVSPVPCHHYVDITSPTKSLVLSRDEYVPN